MCSFDNAPSTELLWQYPFDSAPSMVATPACGALMTVHWWSLLLVRFSFPSWPHTNRPSGNSLFAHIVPHRTLYGTQYRCLESLKGIQQQASEEITYNHFELFFIYIDAYSGWIVWLHLTRQMHSIVGQALHCVASIACAIPMATISSKWLQSRTAAYTSQPLFPVLCSFFCSLQSLTFSSSPMPFLP